MITFAIPSWNRADKLKVCINSILEQIKEVNEQVLITVYNNASDDGTDKVLQEFKDQYPEIISFKNGTDFVLGNESFRRAFLMPETEYTWMMGDDDMLAPKGLEMIVSLLKRKELDFIHAAEATRFNGESRTYFSTMLDLCNGFGFTEMAGFISGNIYRTKPFQEVLKSENVEVYQKSSFFQSVALLDAFSDRPAAFVNHPIVDLQDQVQTMATCERWHKENVSLKYANVSEGLDILLKRGRIPRTLTDEFFRYLSANMFAKVMYNFYEHSNSKVERITEEYWDMLESMAKFLREEEQSRMLGVIAEFKKYLTQYIDNKIESENILRNVQKAHDPAALVVYPETYL